MQPNISAVAQAQQNYQGMQGGGAQQQSQGQPMPQGGNALEQQFAQFLQQQHGQMGEQSQLQFLPWFLQGQGQAGAPQQQIMQTGQSAFEPPTQQNAMMNQAGSGQDLANRSQQQQSNNGGDMSSFFTGGGGYI